LDEITQGGRLTDALNLTSIAGSIVAPATQSQGKIVIPNGWDTRRMSVTLTFNVSTGFGVTLETVNGYSSHTGLSRDGQNLDPQMEIFLTGHETAVQKRAMGSAPSAVSYGKCSSSQLLGNTQHVGIDGIISATTRMARPTDLLSHQDNVVNNYDLPSIIDQRGVVGGGYSSSSTDNVTPSVYLSKVMGAYKEASATVGNHRSSGHGIMAAAAVSDSATETEKSESILFRTIGDYSQLTTTGRVTVTELARMFPNFDHVTHVSLIPRTGMTDLTGHVNHWGGSNLETNIALMLTQSIPSFMATYMIGTYGFAMDNHVTNFGQVGQVGNNHVNFIETGWQGKLELPDNPIRADYVKQSITGILVPQILAAGVGDFIISCTVNSLGSCSVSLSINGGHTMEFSNGVYSNALSTPIGVHGMDQVREISDGIVGATQGAIKDSHLTAGGYDDIYQGY